ncbi:Uncharacterized protein Adt_36017 [Abeliophyllum distichum]|uniref:Uncharacterized protein n=1 Tax=Abeliophyllum distichum TaxID=126358 RepID=A0ABD1QGD4_9LAMI
MAPKRKDPPTKKGKEKAGSSSGRHRPVETNVDDECILRFWGPEEEHIYNKWLMQKHIWAEREVILTDFPYSEMANLIHSCGWQRVAGKPHLAYPLLVKEFFANFNHAIEEPKADHRYTTWCASSRSPIFSCLINVLCLADGVPLLPHKEPESPEPPITKQTFENPVARRAADNLAPIPAAETNRLLRQIFSQLSEQGQVLHSIQRTQLAM